MRTEDDLREALRSLEEEAPSMSRVLPAHPARRWRRLRWGGLGLIAAAAAAVTIVSQAPRTSPVQAGPDWRVKLMAALNSSAGEILYSHTTDFFPNHLRSFDEDWCSNCLSAHAGDVIRDRTLVLNQNGSLNSDILFVYTQPATTGFMTDVTYATRTWTVQKAETTASILGPWSPAQIQRALASGHWAEVGTTRVNGHAAIELRAKLAADSPILQYLWVDARTYLPLRQELTNDGTVLHQTGFQLLPATSENLAMLNLTIPPGFRRITGWQPPGR